MSELKIEDKDDEFVGTPQVGEKNTYKERVSKYTLDYCERLPTRTNWKKYQEEKRLNEARLGALGCTADKLSPKKCSHCRDLNTKQGKYISVLKNADKMEKNHAKVWYAGLPDSRWFVKRDRNSGPKIPATSAKATQYEIAFARQLLVPLTYITDITRATTRTRVLDMKTIVQECRVNPGYKRFVTASMRTRFGVSVQIGEKTRVRHVGNVKPTYTVEQLNTADWHGVPVKTKNWNTDPSYTVVEPRKNRLPLSERCKSFMGYDLKTAEIKLRLTKSTIASIIKRFGKMAREVAESNRGKSFGEIMREHRKIRWENLVDKYCKDNTDRERMENQIFSQAYKGDTCL